MKNFINNWYERARKSLEQGPAGLNQFQKRKKKQKDKKLHSHSIKSIFYISLEMFWTIFFVHFKALGMEDEETSMTIKEASVVLMTISHCTNKKVS